METWGQVNEARPQAEQGVLLSNMRGVSIETSIFHVNFKTRDVNIFVVFHIIFEFLGAVCGIRALKSTDGF